MSMRVQTLLSMFVAIGALVSWAARDAMGQDVALADKKPRFLYRPSPTVAPVEIDVSRTAILRRPVTLKVDHPTIGRLLTAIEKQTGLTFVYGVGLEPARPVLLRADSISVAGALTVILLNTGFDVVLSPGKTVALVERKGAGVNGPTGQVVGKVTDAKTGNGIGQAEVFLGGTRWRTLTDSGGRYRLANVDAGNYTLSVRRLGYAKQGRAIAVADSMTDTVNIALEPAATRLDELVTTATGPRRRMDIANDITTINADSVMQAAPIKSLTDLLDTRVPGLTLQRTSGAPGDPARLRLRGAGSVLRSNDPIVVVDGIRVYSDQSAVRSSNLAAPNAPSVTLAYADARPQGYAAPSPIDYIDPNTIETIEVLKGPSAAALYGPDAANGVIVVSTKKGKAGPSRWTASVEQAREQMAGQYPELLFRWGHLTTDNVPVNCPISNYVQHDLQQYPCVGDSVVPFQILNDPALTILDRSRRTSGSLTVSGGTQALTYAVTGTYSDELGLIKLPDYQADRYQALLGVTPPDWMRRPQHLKQWGATSNIQARLGATGELSLTTRLSHHEQQRSSLETQIPLLMRTYFDRASGNYYSNSSFGGAGGIVYGPSAISDPLRDFYQRVTDVPTTFTNQATLNYRPRSWLTVNAVAGIDVIQRADQAYIPRGPNVSGDPGLLPDTVGHLTDAQGRTVTTTMTLSGSALRPLGRGFHAQFVTGVNYVGTSANDVTVRTSDLPSGTSVLGAVIDNYGVGHTETSNATFGWYLAPSVGNSRFNVESGLRLDSGKNFGANASVPNPLDLVRNPLRFFRQSFPKLGFSYLLSDEPWFPLKGMVQSLRMRVSYGRASRQPGPGDKFRLYGTQTPVATDGSILTGIELQTLGNTELRPERSGEFEGGFDADLLDNRLTLAATVYRKTTDDALMPFPVPASVYGNNVSIVKNIGTIRNTGLELDIQGQPVRSGSVAWNLGLQLSQRRDVVVRLAPGMHPFFTDVSGNYILGGQRVVPGYPLFGRWARPVLGYFDDNGDGVLSGDEVRIGDSAIYVGSTIPTYTADVHTTLSFWHGALSVDATLHHDGGTAQRNAVAVQLAPYSAALWDPLESTCRHASLSIL